LLARCRRRDATAWLALVERFQPLIYAIARRYGLNQEDAGDVYAHTLTRLLRSLDRIESGAVIGRWLGVTASRECLRILRSNSPGLFSELEGVSLDELVATEEGQAEQEAILADQALRATTALARMPERCRTLLELLYTSDGLTYAEVSERTGIPIGAIGPTRARCLEKLRALLDARGFFD